MWIKNHENDVLIVKSDMMIELSNTNKELIVCKELSHCLKIMSGNYRKTFEQKLINSHTKQSASTLRFYLAHMTECEVSKNRLIIENQPLIDYLEASKGELGYLFSFGEPECYYLISETWYKQGAASDLLELYKKSFGNELEIKFVEKVIFS